MRRICVLTMLSMLCCLLQAQLQPSIQWRHSLSEGLRDANGKRMILVFVGTTWEPWTASVKSRLDGDNSDQFTRAARRELLSSYIPVKLDAGAAEGKRLCLQYKIKSFPMFLYMSARGKLIMKRAGYGERSEFADRLILVRQLLPLIAQSEQRLKTNPQDALGLEVLAMTYAKRWMPEPAKAMLARASQRDPHNRAGELAVAYNSLGDYYQMRYQFQTAIALFQKGAAVAKNTAEKAYSLYSISSCYFTKGDEPDKVRKYAEAELALPNLSPGDRAIGEGLLGRSGNISAERSTAMGR